MGLEHYSEGVTFGVQPISGGHRTHSKEPAYIADEALKPAISLEVNSNSLIKITSDDDLQKLVEDKERVGKGSERDVIMETKAGFMKQLYYLYIREGDNTFRNKGTLHLYG